MENHVLQLVIPATGLISGLIGAYVGLQNRALLAEVRKELAELENRIITRINGTYVRAGECHLREANLQARLEMLSEEIRNNKAAGD
jgi:hypothetical protein